MKPDNATHFIRPFGTINVVHVPNPAVNCWAILVCPCGAKRRRTPSPANVLSKRNMIGGQNLDVSSAQHSPGRVRGVSAASLRRFHRLY